MLTWGLLLACAGTGASVEDSAPTGTGLESLQLSGVSLEPAFANDQRHYVVQASELADGPTNITAIAQDHRSTVTVRHTTIDGVELATGGSGMVLDLEVAHRIEVAVSGSTAGGKQTYSVVVLPEDWPRVTATQWGEPSPGYFFLGTTDFTERPCEASYVLMIVDNQGVPVWYRTQEWPTHDFRVTGAGELSYLGISEETHQYVGRVLDPRDYSVLRELEAVPSSELSDPQMDSHELQVFGDGRVITLARASRLEDLTDLGGGSAVRVLDGVVQERDEDGQLLFQWSTQGHVDYADLPRAQLDNIEDGWEYAHLNSVDVDPSDGNWVVSLRLTSQVFKVARLETTWNGRTYAPGEVIWTLGGAASDFGFIDDEREEDRPGFAGQHSVRIVAGDGLLVFDNASYFDLDTTTDARIVEYDLDAGLGTATPLLSYALEGAGSVAVAGSVQRLDDGHTVVGWGPTADEDGEPLASVSELDADGQQVLRLVLPPSCFSYRAWKFEGDPITGEWVP